MSTASDFSCLLKSRQLLVGSWLSIAHPIAVEALSQTGLHFLLADGEHAPIDPSALMDILPSADRFRMPIVYRVAANRLEYIKAALDFGVVGIMVPMINTSQDAAAAVRAAKYPPVGVRGIGAWRASNYYQNTQNYMRTADHETTVILQIESVEAVRNIDAIAGIEGIDVLYIGPGDLALSQGLEPGRLHQSLLQSYESIIQAARRSNIRVGIDVTNLEYLPTYRKLGIEFFTCRSDHQYLIEGARQLLSQMEVGGSVPFNS